jgi:hypothetical protein
MKSKVWPPKAKDLGLKTQILKDEQGKEGI